jgi:hypothetical protein
MSAPGNGSTWRRVSYPDRYHDAAQKDLKSLKVGRAAVPAIDARRCAARPHHHGERESD